MKNILIQTKLFLLKSLTKDNVTDSYFDWINGPNKSQFISKQQHNIDELRNYVNKKTKDKNVLFLGIFLRESNEHIGNIKYDPINFDNKTAVMGILIGEERWRGKGVAHEVIKSSLEWLNKQYGINHIALGVNPKNISAVKAYQKIGFKKKPTSCITITKKSHLITMTLDL